MLRIVGLLTDTNSTLFFLLQALHLKELKKLKHFHEKTSACFVHLKKERWRIAFIFVKVISQFIVTVISLLYIKCYDYYRYIILHMWNVNSFFSEGLVKITIESFFFKDCIQDENALCYIFNKMESEVR